jgi:hypothetical protein
MLEDKLPKIDTGQIKTEEDNGDGRDREREWNYKNNNHHTTNVSFNKFQSKFLLFFVCVVVNKIMGSLVICYLLRNLFPPSNPLLIPPLHNV